MKPGRLILAALAIGALLGWLGAQHSAEYRYLRALTERHEAYAKYLDTQADDIITNNTLERTKHNGSTKTH